MQKAPFKFHRIALGIAAITLLCVYVLLGAGNGGVLGNAVALFSDGSASPDAEPTAAVQPPPPEAQTAIAASPTVTESVYAEDEDIIDKAAGEDPAPLIDKPEVPKGDTAQPDNAPAAQSGPVHDNGGEGNGG